MKYTFKQTYFHFLIIGLLLCASMILGLSSVSAVDLKFETNLISGLTYTNISYTQGGNNFGGLIFVRSISTIPADTVTVSGDTISCTRQIQGYYFSNQRGLKLRPLDATSLSLMRAENASYNDMSFSGGLFLSCSGKPSDYVYGDAIHELYGQTYHLIAGLQYNWIFNIYNPLFDETLRMFGNYFSGDMFDSIGGIGAMTYTPTCVDTSWTPNTNTVCTTGTLTQISNCGNTRTVAGTLNCATTNPPIVIPPGGGGGTTTFSKDNCTLPSTLACANSSGIDYSTSYYDKHCCRPGSSEIPRTGTTITSFGEVRACSLKGSTYPRELELGYLYACDLAVTTKTPITQADLDGKVLRKHLAKMVSEYAMRKMGLLPKTNRTGCENYIDTANEDAEMLRYMKLACQLGLMGMEADGVTPKASFEPNQHVSRAQFGTILSRMLFGQQYALSEEETHYMTYYEKHLQGLKNADVMTNIQEPMIFDPELRGYVWLMMKRADDLGLVAQRSTITSVIGGGIDALLEHLFE